MNATTRTGAIRHEVRGGEGLRLHVREWGRPDGQPIVLIHGWSQNHLCWAHQYDSALADEFRLVAFGTFAATACLTLRSTPPTTPTPSCGPTTWRP